MVCKCRYLADIYRCTLKNSDTELPEELSDEYLNVRLGMYHFARESHEKNDKVSDNKTWKGMKLYRTVIPCQPNKDIYQHEDGTWNMKKIRDTFISFLCSKNNTNPANSFVEWDEKFHDKTNNPPRCLDHCLTDECVGDVSG